MKLNSMYDNKAIEMKWCPCQGACMGCKGLCTSCDGCAISSTI